jgi:fluoroquinolone resistance protein
MKRTYTEGSHFDNTDFTVIKLAGGEYENCSFSACNFSNADISGIHFIDCRFNSCNFSLTKLASTVLRDIQFTDCKLLGLHFDHCDSFLFAANFENCNLHLSSFYKLKLKKTLFKKTALHEVDFTEADLSNAVFDHCDLAGSIFENTLLEKANLRTADNYSIDPEKNKIKKAKFSMPGIAGLLHKYDIEIY